MVQTVILLRHARTEWNVQGRFNSTVDLGIDEQGARQAVAVATELAALAPFGFVRSDARRARETAAPLAKLVDRAPEVEPRLAELDFGPFEGRAPAALADDPTFLAWERGEVPPSGGPEGLDAAADRASAGFLDALARHGDERTLVIVSHGVLLRILLCRVVLELPASAYRRLVLDNARAAVLKVGATGPRFRLAAMNVSTADLDVPDA